MEPLKLFFMIIFFMIIICFYFYLNQISKWDLQLKIQQNLWNGRRWKYFPLKLLHSVCDSALYILIL